MKEISLEEVVKYCQNLLRVSEIEDWPQAMNGLQVANSGKVSRVAAAVDISPNTLRMACEAMADLMLFHHGFFWSGLQPWTGVLYEIIRDIIQNDIALYSVHLPLDAHPQIGNNALLTKMLELENPQPFMEMKGQNIGIRGTRQIERQKLKTLLEEKLGAPCTLLPFGPKSSEAIGIVSGGAGEETADAHLEGIDTYITGEGPHWTWVSAQELKINVIYGGHYKTESFGVQALAEELFKEFSLPWLFLDDPSGL